MQGKKLFWQELLSLNETPPVPNYFHKVISAFVQSYCPCLLDAVCLQCPYALPSLYTVCMWPRCSLRTDAGSWWPWLCWEKWAKHLTNLSNIEKVILKLYCQRERMPVFPCCALTSFMLILPLRVVNAVLILKRIPTSSCFSFVDKYILVFIYWNYCFPQQPSQQPSPCQDKCLFVTFGLFCHFFPGVLQ